MEMEVYAIALIIRRHENHDGFLLVKQNRPPKLEDEEYDALLDSDVWDLPSTRLTCSEEILDSSWIDCPESVSEKIDFRKFDVQSAIRSVLGNVELDAADVTCYKFVNLVEEAQFGPGFVHTVYVSTQLKPAKTILSGNCKWMSIEDCLRLTVDVKISADRIGPLIFGGLINESIRHSRKIDTSLKIQEYPPGIMLVPMASRTCRPFTTTNLVILAPEKSLTECDTNNYVACGDALVVDPGCSSESHGKLEEIISTLPKKLIIFLTHHHRDHVDGLSIVKKVNPNAILLSHTKTLQRITEEDWCSENTPVSGGEFVWIGGQILQVLYAPGHTDGHMGLFHISTGSLIVGDHCVGHGSAGLDANSGGNVNDYFSTTYNFIDLAPHVLISMHGRLNMWPRNMLCRYLKNRRVRESSILQAIESGKRSLMDVVACVYADTDPCLWKQASWNVKLHVDHLALQNKLPSEFSLQ